MNIPQEKKEQERLKRFTGAKDLNNIAYCDLKKHIILQEKTPSDYYRNDTSQQEMNKRLDEAFGPKTDFSVWNFERNYDKLNKEEQEMLVHKMQLEFNNLGYRDVNGHRLKPDGKFGTKTKGVYEKYKLDNKDELDQNGKIQEGIDYQVLKNDDGTPLYIATTQKDIKSFIPENTVSQNTPDFQYKPLQHKIELPRTTNTKKLNKNVEEISKYSSTVQTELLKLKVAWYIAETQEEKDAIHAEANRIRQMADHGFGRFLDVGKTITGAAADEFAYFLGGDVSRAERDFWLTQLQKFDLTVEIEEKEALNSLMFFLSMSLPSPDDVWKMVSKQASKDLVKKMGKNGINKFVKAMTKYVKSKEGYGGIKYLGKPGKNFQGKYYQYEVKIPRGHGGGYRLLGNLDEKGEPFFTIFDNPHK